MYKLNIEHRILKDTSAIPSNIARHIRDYQVYGRVVIVADDPQQLLARMKTAWRQLMKEMRADVFVTHDRDRKAMLVNQLFYMRDCTMAAKPLIDDPPEQVIIVTVAEVLEWAPICQTMYITCAMESSERHRATAWMPPYGLLVVYEITKEAK